MADLSSIPVAEGCPLGYPCQVPNTCARWEQGMDGEDAAELSQLGLRVRLHLGVGHVELCDAPIRKGTITPLAEIALNSVPALRRGYREAVPTAQRALLVMAEAAASSRKTPEARGISFMDLD